MHFANVLTPTKARTQLRKVKLYTWDPPPPALTPTFLSWPFCAAQKITRITFGTDRVYGVGMEVLLGFVTGNSKHYVWHRNVSAIGCCSR